MTAITKRGRGEMVARRRIVGTFLLALVITAAGIRAAPAAEQQRVQTTAVTQVVNALGWTLGDRAKLLMGKILATDLPRSADSDLAAVAGMFLATPFETIAERLKRLYADEQTADWLRWARVRLPIDAAEWAGAAFTAAERNEVARILNVEQGPDLNLSGAEIAALRAAFANLSIDTPGVAQVVSEHYRRVLINRLESYARSGLAGIAAYDRGNGQTTSPADAFRRWQGDNRPLLGNALPQLFAALGSYPEPAPTVASNRFLWAKTTIQTRPAFVLIHHLVEEAPDHLAIVRRRFFVGHTYDALEGILLAFPWSRGSLLLRLNRVSTELVAGPFSGFERDVGQTRSKRSVQGNLRGLREMLLR